MATLYTVNMVLTAEQMDVMRQAVTAQSTELRRQAGVASTQGNSQRARELSLKAGEVEGLAAKFRR